MPVKYCKFMSMSQPAHEPFRLFTTAHMAFSLLQILTMQPVLAMQ